MIFYLFIVLLVVYIYKYYKDYYFYWRNQGVKGLFPFPIINSYYYYLFYPMHDADLKNLERFGPVWAQFATSTFQELMICEPELIKEVLVKNFRQYNGRNDGSMFSKYFQKVLFMRDETNGWRHIRQTISPLFTTGKLKNLYSNLNKPMYNLIEKVDSQLDVNNRNDNFNPLIMFKRFTWDITLNLFFSVKFNSVNIEDDFIENFLSAKPTGLLGNMAAILTPLCIAKMFEITPMDKKTYDYLVQISLNCIQERKKDTQSNRYNDLLQLLIQTGLSDEEIVGQCIALFLGGFESVASSSTYAIYELALHPEIQDRLYTELKRNYPDDSLEIDYESITSSEYLEAFIKEVLRKHPAISKIFRKALVDSELGGIKIKKETFISIPIFALHHYEKYWPNAIKFNPSRFLNKEIEPFTYLPFSDGSRQCIAKRLAELELRYFLINFLKRYEVYRTPLTKCPLTYSKFSFLFSSDNVIVGIRKRNSE